MLRSSIRRICGFMVAVAGFGTAYASPLPVGGTLFPAPAEANPSPGANLLFSTGPVGFVATPAVFSGTLVSSVYNNDTTNPFGLDRMTFTYQITSDPSSINLIARLSLGSYGGFATDASYQSSPLLAPAFIDRPTAPVVGFSFQGPPVGPGALAPGQTTALLVVQTDAPAYGAILANVIDGGQANNIPSVGPTIPEPGSLAVIAGLAGLLVRRRSGK